MTGLSWFVIGLGAGLAIAWLAEYGVDWRHRRRERGVDGEVLTAMQRALTDAERELAELRSTSVAPGSQMPADREAASDEGVG